LVKKGGVSMFDDLAAYSSLFRPGPLCLPKGTLISTSNGKKSIEQLLTWHDEVKYIDKNAKVSKTKKFLMEKTGVKKLVKIKTKSGKETIVSVDHPFLTDKDKFVAAKNLKKNDRIAISDTI